MAAKKVGIARIYVVDDSSAYQGETRRYHVASAIANDRGVDFVSQSFGRPVVSADRRKAFVDAMVQTMGQKPKRAEEWLRIGTANLGSGLSVSLIIDSEYSTDSKAKAGEQKLVDEGAAERAQVSRSRAIARVLQDADSIIGEMPELMDKLADGAELSQDEDSSLVTLLSLLVADVAPGESNNWIFDEQDGVEYEPPSMSVDLSRRMRGTLSLPSEKAAPVFEPPEQGEALTAAAGESCPIATQDVKLNLANRQKAIEGAGYGPLNPGEMNASFWEKKAERWDVSPAEARRSLCGNCSMFIQTPSMLSCIESGLSAGGGRNAWDVIDAGDLGYCEAFDFKCAASRTCDAWVAGGPVVEERREER